MAGQGVGPAGRPLCPFNLWFGPIWSTCHKHSCSDTIFRGILNIIVISWNAPIWHLCSWNWIDTKIMELVSSQGKYMVISYIYLICWHMKLAFYERKQPSRSSRRKQPGSVDAPRRRSKWVKRFVIDVGLEAALLHSGPLSVADFDSAEWEIMYPRIIE
jgi:hypothetical protein